VAQRLAPRNACYKSGLSR